jgi:hypothetical protein
MSSRRTSFCDGSSIVAEMNEIGGDFWSYSFRIRSIYDSVISLLWSSGLSKSAAKNEVF